MSTPNMSGRTDAPEPTSEDDRVEVSDLLDENGKIDLSAVRSVATSDNGSNIKISPQMCADIRASLLETQDAHVTCKEFDIGSTATRDHAKGDCHHDEEDVDATRLRYVFTDGWVVADEVDNE